MWQIVVFDLDGTLIQEDSFVRFLLGFLRHRPIRIIKVLHLPLALIFHYIGLRDNTWLKTTFLKAFIGGLSRKEVEVFAEKFADRLVKKSLLPKAYERIRDHQEKKDLLVLATASPDIYVNYFAKKSINMLTINIHQSLYR